MGDVLGIKFEAIGMILELYEINDNEERLELFEKILAIDSIRLKFRSNELIKNNKNNKSKK